MANFLYTQLNRYTGNKVKPLSEAEKYAQTIIPFSKANAVRSTVNNGYKIQDEDWFTMRGSIFKKENWRQLNVKNDVLLDDLEYER